MRARHKWFWIKLALAIVSVAYGASIVYARYADRRVARNILSLERLPASVSVRRCKSTDGAGVGVVCAVTLRPSDSTAILAGYDFTRDAASGLSSARVPGHPGREFGIAAIYMVAAPPFLGQGHVRVMVDSAWRRALVDLHIE